eukprot:gene8204-1466_t
MYPDTANQEEDGAMFPSGEIESTHSSSSRSSSPTGTTESAATEADPDFSSRWIKWLSPSWYNLSDVVTVQVFIYHPDYDHRVHTTYNPFAMSHPQGDDGVCNTLVRSPEGDRLWQATPNSFCKMPVNPIVCVPQTSLPIRVRARTSLGSDSPKPSSPSEGAVRWVECGLSVNSTFSGQDGEPDLIANYQGIILPFRLKECVRPTQQGGGQSAPSTQKRNSMRQLGIYIDLSELPATAVAFSPELATLEAWKDGIMLQQVPLLLIPPNRSELVDELAGLRYNSVTCRQGGQMHNARLTTFIGLWMRYVAEHSPIISGDDGNFSFEMKDEDGDAAFQTHLRCSMLHIGCNLFHLAVQEGWLHLSNSILDTLTSVKFGIEFSWLNDATISGSNLLYKAASSGKIDMMAQVMKWGIRFSQSFSWMERASQTGRCPLHAAVEADTSGDFVSAILRRIPQTTEAWFTAKDNRGMTPEAQAASIGCSIHQPSLSEMSRAGAQGAELDEACQRHAGSKLVQVPLTTILESKSLC